MFNKETYTKRRAELKKLVGNGVIILFGNNEAPANYPANTFAPMVQDSSFLYYFGQHRDGLVGVIDIDNDVEMLLGDDIDVEDIVWMGYTPSVADLAAEVGVTKTAPMAELKVICDKAKGRAIHFLPPYRHDIMIQIMDLLGIHPSQQKEKASLALIQAVVKMRSTKTPQEIELIEKACDVGYAMHTTAQLLIRPGVTERFVAGQVDGVARSLSLGNAFPTIFSQHGEIMHGSPSDALLEAGRIVICDAGSNYQDYSSDHTRTMPVTGKFTQSGSDEGRHRRGCCCWCSRHVPASRTGTHDGYGRTRHGGTGTDLRGLRRGDSPQSGAVWHQLSAHGPQAGRGLCINRRARHLLHSSPHRRLEGQRTLQGVPELRQAGDLQGLRRRAH